MGPAGVERKVRQLDNDVQSIYEMLSTIHGTQQRHGNRLTELEDRVIALDAKVDGLDAKVDALDARLGAHDGRFDTIEAKVDTLGARMETVLDLLRDR